MVWSILPLCVIEDLVLGSKYGSGIIRHPVFYTAVTTGDDFPLEGKFEVFETPFGIEAARFLLADYAPVFHVPTGTGLGTVLVRPTIEGFAVEEREGFLFAKGRPRQ